MQPAFETIVPQACAVSVAAIAAIVDHRTGKIPNWLTLPMLVLGAGYWGAVHGVMGFAESVGGMLVCGVPALVVYKAAGMPGGDLKLFATVGAWVLPTMGLEVELFALLAASAVGVFMLFRRGRLLSTLLDTLYAPLNRFLPKAKRRAPTPEPTEQIRIGPFVLFGTLVAIARHSRQWMP